MAQTLTNLIPDFYRALDVVSRELTGFVAASTLDAGTARAAVNQPVRVAVTTPAAAENTTPGVTAPDTGDQTVDNVQITISKSRTVPFKWVGEEQRGLNVGGPGYLTVKQGQIAQALRTLVNEIEIDMGTLYVRSSRAYGTAGTAPFGGATPSMLELSMFRKILVDNGAPVGDLQLVIDSTAGAYMRAMPNLVKVNESGDQGLLRQGVLGNLYDFAIRESAGVALHTNGTGSAYVLAAAGALKGATTVPLDGGTGTMIAGDAVTFQNDTNIYIVGTALSGGNVIINKPGLLAAHVNDETATISADFKANMGFSRSAMILATRPPALPEEGDAASDRMLITDPRTGLTFELAIYPQYRRTRFEVSLAWGFQNIKPEHTAIWLG